VSALREKVLGLYRPVQTEERRERGRARRPRGKTVSAGKKRERNNRRPEKKKLRVGLQGLVIHIEREIVLAIDSSGKKKERERVWVIGRKKKTRRPQEGS